MEDHGTPIETLARTQALARLSPNGQLFEIIRQLEQIEPDTSPDIRQLCISCRNEFNVFRNRANVVKGANFPQMLIELNKFEARCRHVVQEHTALFHGLVRTSHRLWEDLVNLQNELNAYAARRPRMEYDVSETSGQLQAIIAAYPRAGESYARLHEFITHAQRILKLAQKDRTQLEQLWQSYLRAHDQAAKALMDMRMALDEYQQRGQVSWAWVHNASQKALDSTRDSYEKHGLELKQAAQPDIVLKQAISICERIEREVRLDLQTAISKLEPVQEQQVRLGNMLGELQNITQRPTIFTITPKHSDLIRQFCALAVQAETFENARMNLELARQILERSITREDAVQIIQNYDLKIESRNIGQSRVPAGGSADVFISYARLDIEAVQDLYTLLLDNNHRPWMDVHSIKGGENWFHAITRAIDECEIFLAILSSHSVSRRGVLQKELKKALDRWEEMLPDDIYIIPIRIDECPIPDVLKPIHVLDWDHGRGRDKLLEAIRTGLERRREKK